MMTCADKMNLPVLCIILTICAWTSVAMGSQDQPTLTEDQLASSPLIRQLVARVESLETQGTKQQEEIQTLKAEMSQQRVDMRTLRSQLRAKDRILQALYNKHSKSNGEDQLLTKELNQADSKMPTSGNVQAKETRRHVRGDGNRIKRAENEEIIAFSAALTQPMHVGDNQNIVFDHVLTNVGNAYNPHHGVFVAPVSGVYVFSTSVLSFNSNFKSAYITVNSAHKSLLQLPGKGYAFGSQTMVFQLNQGDDVAIHGHAGDPYFGIPIPSYTTFSGFLLQQNHSSVGNIIG